MAEIRRLQARLDEALADIAHMRDHAGDDSCAGYALCARRVEAPGATEAGATILPLKPPPRGTSSGGHGPA